MAFDPDAYLRENPPPAPKAKGKAKVSAFDPDAYLAAAKAEREASMPLLPENMDPGRIDVRSGQGKPLPAKSVTSAQWVPEKRTRATFTDRPYAPMTAEELGGAKKDTKEEGRNAFIGGALQGATLGFGDEAAAAWQSLTGEKSYREARDENRKVTRDLRADRPKDYVVGNLTGSAALLAATPSLAPTAAKPLLSVTNMGRAAGVGALTGLGESEADLTQGDFPGAIKDAAKGAAIAAGANAALGGLGYGIRKGSAFLSSLPERAAKRADDALIDAATLGAPSPQRDALMGDLGSDRPNMLALIKGNPELRKAIDEGRKADATTILRSLMNAHKAADVSEMAAIDSGRRSIDVEPIIANYEARAAALEASPSAENLAAAAALRKRAELARDQFMPERPLEWEAAKTVEASPIVKRLEAQRDAAAANPAAESQAEAARIQKLIDHVKERWVPEPPPPVPKGNELLGKLVEGADTGDKQRAGLNAAEFIATAEKNKLGPAYAKGPDALLKKIDQTLEGLNKKTAGIYDGTGKDVYVANVTGKLREWADELRAQPLGLRTKDAENIDALAFGIAQSHANTGKPTLTPKELRKAITDIQGEAFSGSYLDPTKAKAMQRELTARLRGILDEHVVTNGSKADLKKLGDLNKQISALIAFRDAAEKRAGAAKLLPPPAPETRTGIAPAADAIAMANATEDPKLKASLVEELTAQLGSPVADPNRGRALPSEIREMAASTKDVDLRRDITGELYRQTGTEAAHRMAALDDQAERMARLEAPLTHIAERGATPPTTLRHHAGSIKHYLESGGITTGAYLMGIGHFKEGLGVITVSLAAKYGSQAVKASERGLAAMASASRMGATATQLRSLARSAKVPYELAEDAITMMTPHQAATREATGQ